jgi:hypothetical protein
MRATSETPTVVNAFTDRHGWLAKVEAAMKDGHEILLLLRPAKDSPQSELLRLSREYGYSAPANIPQERWNEYKPKLQLSDLATKEQAITPEMVHVLKPA